MKNIEILFSSCIIVNSSMKKWSINNGDRQKGSVRSNSVFDVQINEQIIEMLSCLLKKILLFQLLILDIHTAKRILQKIFLKF